MTKTRSRKALPIVLVLVIVVFLFAGLSLPASAAYTPTGTMTTLAATPTLGLSGTVWSISSKAELEALATYVNTNNNTSGVTFYLTSSISLNPAFEADVNPEIAGVAGYNGLATITEWTSIGGGAAGHSFKGLFDGCNYTINYIFYNQSTGSYSSGDSLKNNVGLFGKLEENATIINLNISGGYFGAQRSVGGIVGKNWGTMDNCHNLGTTVYSNQSKGVGGIVGANWVNSTSNPPTITNSSNAGAVISAYSSGSAGGIAGENEGHIYNCFNTGSVTSPYNAGGIAGSNKNDYNKQTGTGGTVYGGINNCYNSGTISGGVAGGIAAYQMGSMRNCYNIGGITGSSYAGQLIGELNSSFINAPLYYSTTISVSAVGRTISGAFTADSFGSTDDDKDGLVYDLNDWVDSQTAGVYAYWTRDENNTINNGYPIFS